MLKRSLLFGGVITLFAFAGPTETNAQDPSGSLSADGMFTVALTGDAIITRRLSPYKETEYLDMIELVRSADASFVNLEVLFHDYEPYPASSSGGTYMRADPNLANELIWAGFDMVSMANNHTGDLFRGRAPDHAQACGDGRAAHRGDRGKPGGGPRGPFPRDARRPRRADLGVIGVHRSFDRRSGERRRAGASGTEPRCG